jgi:hypothetical protein
MRANGSKWALIEAYVSEWEQTVANGSLWKLLEENRI